MNDQQALERYRYLLRTAPPDAIEKAHEEAFAQLNPEQRRQVLQGLSEGAPEEERRGATDDPQSLARLATRTELRQPGILERMFGRGGGQPGIGGGGGMGGGLGMGGFFAGSLLSSLAGTVIGSAIAQNFFQDHPMESSGFSGDQFASGETGTADGDTGASGLGDELGPDAAYDSGDVGGDLGGGDFDMGGDV